MQYAHSCLIANLPDSSTVAALDCCQAQLNSRWRCAMLFVHLMLIIYTVCCFWSHLAVYTNSQTDCSYTLWHPSMFLVFLKQASEAKTCICKATFD